MKKTILSICLLFATGAANADMVKPAFLGLVCVVEAEHTKIVISSDSSGSILIVDDKLVAEKEFELTAGTEGGSPYLQFVDGGYNVTISGGDFEKAFYDSSLRFLNGSTNANVWHGGKTKSAKCRGIIAF